LGSADPLSALGIASRILLLDISSCKDPVLGRISIEHAKQSEGSMTYRIDPESDRQFIEEFRRQPIGAHSPGLQRLLNLVRHDPSGWQVILVCRKPFAEWVLGLMPPDRAGPISIEDSPIFTSREAAEWEVFRRRWRLHTGEDLNLPFRD